MVTVIATSGRMGATVTSDWIEAPPLGAPMPTVREFLKCYIERSLFLRQKTNQKCK